MTIKVVLGKYAKSLNFKQWFKCVYIAAALIIIAFLYHVADSIITSVVDPVWLKSLYLLGMIFVLGSVIWFLAFVSPKLFQFVFQMVGVKGSEAEENLSIEDVPIKNENIKNERIKREIKQAPSNQEMPKPEEESDSEKLRNEFKNRTL